MIQFGNKRARPPNSLLRYGPNAYALPTELEQQFIAYCEAVGVPWQNLLITNTWRSPEDQARVMVQQYGTPEVAAAQYRGEKGSRMCREWRENLDSGTFPDSQSALTQAIMTSGFVSNHMRSDRATLDIDPNTIPSGLIHPFKVYLVGLGKSLVNEALEPGEGGEHAFHVAFIPSGDWAARAEAAAAAAVGLDDESGEGGESGDGVSSGWWLAIGGSLGLLYWAMRQRR